MLRQVALFGIALAGLAARDPGCGDVDSHGGSVNAPCTRDTDCKDDLTCREGVCASRDAGAGDGGGDAQVKDAAHDGS